MNWPLRPVNELCVFATDCVNKTAPTVDYETRFKMIRTTNVKGGFIDLDIVRYVTEETFNQWTRRSRPLVGDVVLTREAPVGEVGRVTFEDENVMLGQRLFQYRPDPDLLDSNFLAYVLQSPAIQGALHGKSFGATVPHIRVGDAETMPIPCPPLPVQRRIGDTLAAYDDLIENNQRRIQLLEEAARRLYREWFVALRFPGHERVQVVDGVPLGWKHRPLSESASYLNRGISPAYDDSAPGLVINQKCIRNGLLNLTPARRQAKDVPSDKRIRLGDILINSTGTGTLGRVAQVRGDLMDCTVDTHVTILRPANQEALAFWGVACLEMEPRFSEMGIGATNQQELIRAHVGAIELLVPPIDLQSDFHARAWPMLLQSEMLGKQSEILKQARDALLPRLMSGALAV